MEGFKKMTPLNSYQFARFFVGDSVNPKIKTKLYDFILNNISESEEKTGVSIDTLCQRMDIPVETMVGIATSEFTEVIGSDLGYNRYIGGNKPYVIWFRDHEISFNGKNLSNSHGLVFKSKADGINFVVDCIHQIMDEPQTTIEVPPDKKPMQKKIFEYNDIRDTVIINLVHVDTLINDDSIKNDFYQIYGGFNKTWFISNDVVPKVKKIYMVAESDKSDVNYEVWKKEIEKINKEFTLDYYKNYDFEKDKDVECELVYQVSFDNYEKWFKLNIDMQPNCDKNFVELTNKLVDSLEKAEAFCKKNDGAETKFVTILNLYIPELQKILPNYGHSEQISIKISEIIVRICSGIDNIISEEHELTKISVQAQIDALSKKMDLDGF